MIKPIFHSIDDLQKSSGNKDYEKAKEFLLLYKNNNWTFMSYRRELEKIFQYIKIKSTNLAKMNQQSFLDFLEFCKNPPKDFLATSKFKRTCENWRPFIAGMSDTAISNMYFILKQFFDFLSNDDYIKSNPVAKIRQRSHFLSISQTAKKIRKFSVVEMKYLLKEAEKTESKIEAERTLFALNCCYRMYLRVSELTKTKYYTPMMNDFYQDSVGSWWFKTIGKYNKARQIAVSDKMLCALKRWRNFLSLSDLPTKSESGYLVPKNNWSGTFTKIEKCLKSTDRLRTNLKCLFERTAMLLEKDGFTAEAANMRNATIHWLRHTGISDDVKTRPREHVRDDAGHSSILITDRYIDVTLKERHASAKSKTLEI